MLVHQLIEQGEKDAVAFQGNPNITYRQLQEMVGFYRDFLYQQGIRVGKTVGLFSLNSVEFVYSYMAIISLGAIVVPINTNLTLREILYIAKDAKMEHLITMYALDFSVADSADEAQNIKQLVIPEFSANLFQMELQKAPELGEGFSDQESCAIIYTSGTTGNPKGAVLSHRNLVENAKAITEPLAVSEKDTVLCILPLYHCFAWTCTILNSLCSGARIVILSTFVPKETLLAIREHKVSVVYGVPPIYNLLLRVGQREDMAGIRIFVSGGASLPQKVAEHFYEKFGRALIEGYGLSEASPVVAINPHDCTKYCSIGKPLFGLTVKIVDQDEKILPAGEVGELVVKGPSVMKGYYNLPLDTARTIRSGWLHTGDLAYMDQEGYIFIVDRLKDMIIVNGENVYPREVEEVLYTFPDIVEATVIGVPDGLRGQAVCAYVVMAEDKELDKKGLKDFLKPRLAGYKIPRDFIQVEALPKNNTGKILKRVLVEQVLLERNGERAI